MFQREHHVAAIRANRLADFPFAQPEDGVLGLGRIPEFDQRVGRPNRSGLSYFQMKVPGEISQWSTVRFANCRRPTALQLFCYSLSSALESIIGARIESFTSSNGLVCAVSFAKTLMMWNPYCVLTRSRRAPRRCREKGHLFKFRDGLTLERSSLNRRLCPWSPDPRSSFWQDLRIWRPSLPASGRLPPFS